MEMLARFLDFLFPPADTARAVAQATSADLGALLSPTVRQGGTVTLLPYRHTLVRAAILEAKFHKSSAALTLLGGILKDYVASIVEESAELGDSKYCVVPIPLGPQRRLARGYNQVEEIARYAKTDTATGLLIRTRDTLPQTSLTRRARLSNMERAFQVTGVIDPSVTYILIDDVMTTGATLLSAQVALAEAGACKVQTLALAH